MFNIYEKKNQKSFKISNAYQYRYMHKWGLNVSTTSPHKHEQIIPLILICTFCIMNIEVY